MGGRGHLLAWTIGAALALAPAADAATPVLRTTVDPARATTAIPRSFQGLSLEYGSVLPFVGGAPYGTNPAFASLLGRLGSYGGGPPVLRIGGGSSDAVWWNPAGAPKPPGISSNLGPYFTESLGAFVRQTGSPLILGLNMANNDPEITVPWALEALSRLPRGSVRAFELGNEPDIYHERPLGKDAQGEVVYARPKGYGPKDYAREALAMIDRLRERGVQTTMSGPSALPIWAKDAPDLVAGLRAGAELLGFHVYPMSRCGRPPTDPLYPTIPRLLDDRRILAAGRQMAQVAGVAKTGGMRLRITEGNTASCGGVEGVSDRHAAALWAVDWSFLMAVAGVEGLNFHASSPIYAPLYPAFDEQGPRLGAFVGAPYYGMWLFAKATPGGARLVPTATFDQQVRRAANVRAWATVDRRRTVRVVVVNKTSSARGTVRLTIKGATGSATVERLTAPALDSKVGDITVAGQSFPQPTFDGAPSGTPRAARTRVRRGGVIEVRTRGHEALLVTVRTRRR